MSYTSIYTHIVVFTFVREYQYLHNESRQWINVIL